MFPTRKYYFYAQEPDNLRAGLAAAKGHNVSTDRVIEESALIFIRLYGCQLEDAETVGMALTLGKTLAINWLPVTDSAKSTIIARRALNTMIISGGYSNFK